MSDCAWKLLETLGTDEALFMVEISVRVDNPVVLIQLLLAVETMPGHNVVLKCLQRLHLQLLPQIRVVRGGEGLSRCITRGQIRGFDSVGNIQNPESFSSRYTFK